MWWKGPSWPQESEDDWPKDLRSQCSDETVEVERKSNSSVSCIVQPKEPVVDFARFSKYSRLLRTVAWIRRFICNSPLKEDEELSTPLTGLEIQEAEGCLIVHVQETSLLGEVLLAKHRGPTAR